MAKVRSCVHGTHVHGHTRMACTRVRVLMRVCVYVCVQRPCVTALITHDATRRAFHGDRSPTTRTACPSLSACASSRRSARTARSWRRPTTSATRSGSASWRACRSTWSARGPSRTRSARSSACCRPVRGVSVCVRAHRQRRPRLDPPKPWALSVLQPCNHHSSLLHTNAHPNNNTHTLHRLRPDEAHRGPSQAQEDQDAGRVHGPGPGGHRAQAHGHRGRRGPVAAAAEHAPGPGLPHGGGAVPVQGRGPA